MLIYSKQCLLCNRCSKYQYSYLQLLLYFESEYVVELQWFVCVLFSSFVPNHHGTKLYLWLLFIYMQKLSKFLYFVSKTHVISAITIFVGLALLAGYNIKHTYNTYSQKTKCYLNPRGVWMHPVFQTLVEGEMRIPHLLTFSALCYGESTWIIYLVLAMHLIAPLQFHGKQTKISFCLGK